MVFRHQPTRQGKPRRLAVRRHRIQGRRRARLHLDTGLPKITSNENVALRGTRVLDDDLGLGQLGVFPLELFELFGEFLEL